VMLGDGRPKQRASGEGRSAGLGADGVDGELPVNKFDNIRDGDAGELSTRLSDGLLAKASAAATTASRTRLLSSSAILLRSISSMMTSFL